MSLKRFFNKINGIKVVIVGDVMVDSYTFGKIERNSPEAPVPIVNVENKENRIGGAANVALNIKSLGGMPYLCSCIGKDNYGKIFLDLLEKNKISIDSIIIDPKRKTTVKERVIVKKNHIVRIDNETTNDLSNKFQNILREKIFELSKICDLLIIQDYDKGLLNKDFIIDVSGAGDTVIAIASICVFLSTPIPFLCKISNLAGKIVCQSSGVVPINKSILFDKVKENELIKDI